MDTNQLDQLLQYAHEHGATDLHLCAGSKPVIRKNSRLVTIPGTDMLAPQIIREMCMGILLPEQRALLESKKVYDFSFSRSGMGRFRCNIYSQRGTYAVAIRTLPFDIPKLDQLGLPEAVTKFTQFNRGLVLVTGATGSGKSTTLASLIDHINETQNYHIITIEDPIEYLHRHKKSLVTQREIGSDADSFISALRAALREDPDVIMVGEMRDPLTISTAITAAETGHLVFSTLHTVGAAKAIDRIIDAFPSSQQNQVRTQLATVLEGVVSQQLLPRADGSGLIATSEIMISTPAIRNLVRDGKHYQINSLIQVSQAQGMQLMEADLARLLKAGIISKDEAILRAMDKALFNQFMAH